MYMYVCQFTTHCTDVVDSDGQTPLHYACRVGQLEVVKYLVEEVKCDVDVVDSEGATPLHHACRGGELEVVQYLVEEVKCDVVDRGMSPLDYVLENLGDSGDMDNAEPYFTIAEYLINHGCGSDEGKGNLLCEACHWGRLDLVKELVEQHKVDPKDVRDVWGETPLHNACWIGCSDVVQYLVEKTNCDVNETNNHGRTPLDIAKEHSVSTPLGSVWRKRFSEIVDYLQSRSTEQSDDQMRSPSESHDRGSSPSAQSLGSDVVSSQNNTPGPFDLSLATPLSEEDLDALHKLLQDNKVKLPSDQLTFEQVQTILHERGHTKLASNLRVELDKVIKKQQAYLKRLNDLIISEDVIRLRYLKIFLVGPPGVGKTTTLLRMLKHFVNVSSSDIEIPSTLLANFIQVFAFVSCDGTQWISSSGLNQESVLLFRYLCGCNLEDQRVQCIRSFSMKQISKVGKAGPQSVSPRVMPHSQIHTKQPNEPKITINKKKPEQSILSNDGFAREASTKQARIHSFIDRLQKVIISGEYSTLLNTLGSTLLNINDVGGQPGFLEMLPALSTGPAMYLVFFDLSKELDKPYKIPFNRGDTVITPYDALYTVEAAISQILSAITSVHCMFPEISQVKVEEITEFGQKYNRFKQVRPVAAIIGTHKDKLNDAEKELGDIDRLLKQITSRFSQIISNPDASRSFFAVNNFTGTDKCDVGPLRDFMSTIFQSHFKDANLPIRPNWLWLSLILRREYRIASRAECIDITRHLGIDQDELNFALWYLHFFTGTLLYYPSISDEWFKDHIICSPQVVFDSICELIVASMRTLHTGDACTEYDKIELIQKGQFSLESIKKYCSRYQVKEKLSNTDIIPPDQLVQLLEHVNLLAPITHTEADGSEHITYLFPALLECASLDELTPPPPPDPNHSEPLFITFNCGYVPTGSFCGLVTRLVSQGPSGILGLRWELVEASVKRNCASFSIEKTSEVTLIAHEKCFEIRLIYTHPKMRLHDMSSNILSAILYSLKSLYKQLHPLISFKCPCPEHQSSRGIDHLCTLDDGLYVQFLCGKKEIDLNKYQQLQTWFGMPVMIGKNVDLKVPKFAQLDVFSFHWTKEGSKDQIKTTPPNVLTFHSVCEKDFGYYRCEVREAGTVVLTVYRALYRPISAETHRDNSSTRISLSGGSVDRKRSISYEHLKAKRRKLSGKSKLNVGMRSKSSQLSVSATIQDSPNKQDAHATTVSSKSTPSKAASGNSNRKRPHPLPSEGPEAKRPSSSGSPETLTVEKLANTYSISYDQLNCEIEGKDMIMLASYFDGVKCYPEALGLTPAEQADVRQVASTQDAIHHALKQWRQHDPSAATLRTLLEILLRLKKGGIASRICGYYHPKQK